MDESNDGVSQETLEENRPLPPRIIINPPGMATRRQLGALAFSGGVALTLAAVGLFSALPKEVDQNAPKITPNTPGSAPPPANADNVFSIISRPSYASILRSKGELTGGNISTRFVPDERIGKGYDFRHATTIWFNFPFYNRDTENSMNLSCGFTINATSGLDVEPGFASYVRLTPYSDNNQAGKTLGPEWKINSARLKGSKQVKLTSDDPSKNIRTDREIVGNKKWTNAASYDISINFAKDGDGLYSFEVIVNEVVVERFTLNAAPGYVPHTVAVVDFVPYANIDPSLPTISKGKKDTGLIADYPKNVFGVTGSSFTSAKGQALDPELEVKVTEVDRGVTRLVTSNDTIISPLIVTGVENRHIVLAKLSSIAPGPTPETASIKFPPMKKEVDAKLPLSFFDTRTTEEIDIPADVQYGLAAGSKGLPKIYISWRDVNKNVQLTEISEDQLTKGEIVLSPEQTQSLRNGSLFIAHDATSDQMAVGPNYPRTFSNEVIQLGPVTYAPTNG